MNGSHRYIITLLLLISNQIFTQALSPLQNYGDYFYLKHQYNFAIIEYHKLLINNQDEEIKKKLALSYMREGKYDDALNFLSKSNDFSSLYLSIYANMKKGNIDQVAMDFSKADDSIYFNEDQKDKIKLLSLTTMIERMALQNALDNYKYLKKKTSNKEIKNHSEKIIYSIEKINKINKKSPLIAGILSTMIPGSGHMYSNHYIDGIVTMFFNLIFLGSSAYMYNLESNQHRDHLASFTVGIIGLTFYGINIIGSAGAAHRYNSYQEQKFFQEIQKTFFNMDVIEKYSEIKIRNEF